MKHPRACTHMSNARMFICSLLWLTAAVMNAQTVPDPATLVDPLIGSANLGYTFPGAVLPFGMVSFSPEETRTCPDKAEHARRISLRGVNHPRLFPHSSFGRRVCR